MFSMPSPAHTWLWSITGFVLCVTLCTTEDNFRSEQEFCEGETFEAKCPTDKVIVVRSALFGRMRLGRCLRSGVGPMGCSENVRPYMDRHCSGRRACAVKVQLSMASTVPCQSTEFRSYLLVVHTCVKVAHVPTCGDRGVAAAPGSAGYLASSAALTSGLGSLDCPWQVRVPVGQRVRLMLHDFAHGSSEHEKYPKVCHVYATLKEDTPTARETVCSGAQRERLVYTSRHNSVEVRLVAKREKLEKDGHFLLQYEAVGCANFKSVPGASSRRYDDTTYVMCNGTKKQWEMKCVNNRWTGELGDCLIESDTGASRLGEGLLALFQGQAGLSTVLVLAIALALGCSILVIGLIYMKRRNARARAHARQLASPRDIYYQQHLSKPAADELQGNMAENDYYRTWQLRHSNNNYPLQYGSDVTSEPDAYRHRYMDHIYESPDNFDIPHIDSVPKVERGVADDGHAGRAIAPTLAGTQGSVVAKPGIQYYELDPQQVIRTSSDTFSAHATSQRQ